ncbi:efflux RND transporter permease subunit [Bacteriovorax sp. Seq25_V]|uniref:efflux RND transporter permease subunit n=1 Tax=Bacteriovorax sp. Seq25_V TaxID=1201288 RepID=UPI00038A3952|nr:efflux RND transporter permease subunit [Bacteriovorax sp. Seq25_V]EQC46205.1 export membrane protein [Bacteriovorax sp. Seq25_V]
MRKITKYFIDNSFIVNLLSVMMLLIGAISLVHMKRDLISGWSAKRITVSTSLSGAGPAQMEKFVTYPIEQAIKNLPGIDKIRSNSRTASTSITVEVKDEYDDILELEQKIKDAVNNIRSTLPSDLDEINIQQTKMTESWFSNYSLLNFNEEDQNHQRWFYKFKERLKNIQGVARIQDDVREYGIHIRFNLESLARYEIDINTVYSIVQESFRLFPIGNISKGSKDYLVEFETNEVTVEDIGNIILRSTTSKKTLLLRDIATIEKKLPKKTYKEYTNSSPSLSFTIFKDMDTDTISLKENIEKFIEEERANLPQGVEMLLTGDGPAFIERQINALKSNSIFGVILVILTLMSFLGFKTSLMTSFGLPLSYMFTFFILENMGLKIDLISIVGMLLVLGIIVDDAIIISEQYTQNLEKGMKPKEAALEAVLKTWMPITGAVLTTVVAFLPLLMSGDGLSDIMMAIPVVVISALGVSLLESFFILPNHLAHFVKVAPKHHESNFFHKLKDIYMKTLKQVLRFRYLALVSLVSLFGFSIFFAQKNIPMNFNLNISSEKIRVVTVLKHSESLEDSEKQLAPLWKELSEIDKDKFDYINMAIGYVWESGKSKNGPQYGSFTVRFSQLDDNIEANKKYVEDLIKERIKKYTADPKDSIFERIEVGRRYDGHDDDQSNIVNINLSSSAPFDINEVSSKIKKKLSSYDQITSIDLDNSDFIDTWTFKPNKAEILSHGLSIRAVANQVRTFVAKTKVYENNSGPQTLKVYAYSEEGDNQTIETLKNKHIILSNGLKIKTKDLGTWEVIRRQKSIGHENLKRIVRLKVALKKDVADKEKLIHNFENDIKSIESEYSYLTITTKDADEQAQKNKSSMFKNVLFAVGLIVFILAIILRSIVTPFIICSAIPFGLIGIIWAFYFQGLKLDIMAFIGVIAMAGVVVNDSLLLVDTVNSSRGKKKYIDLETLLTDCAKRLRPILLTSITTLGGVFPMAYGIGGDSGFTKPLAMSMGWGLLFATGLTLLILPAYLLIFDDIKKLFSRKKDKQLGDTEIEDENLDQEWPEFEHQTSIPKNKKANTTELFQ